MKISWKVRVKNPLFWVEIVAAIILPILAYFGLSWEDMTSWAALGEVLLEAIQNPVVIVSTVVSVWNAITDPTTKGISDSEQALTYSKPKE
jgi:phi LC3 family holin